MKLIEQINAGRAALALLLGLPAFYSGCSAIGIDLPKIVTNHAHERAQAAQDERITRLENQIRWMRKVIVEAHPRGSEPR